MTTATERKVNIVQKCVFLVFWIGLIIACFIYRDEITVERIVTFTPKEPALAAIIMLCLFAVKSISIFIYGGILYAASGIIFSLPAAIAINTAGTVIMTSIPFFIGKKAGKGILTRLTQKNTKLALLKEFPNKNEFFVSLFVRLVGFLPSDLVSMYLGAGGIRYSRYLAGTTVGLLPSVLSFSVMGMSAEDPSSPAFIISALAEIVLMIVSVLLFIIWKKRSK